MSISSVQIVFHTKKEKMVSIRKRQLKNCQEGSLALKRKRGLAKYKKFISVLFYCIIFLYESMSCLIIVFEDYKSRHVFVNSEFVGIKLFKNYFRDYYFQRKLANGINYSEYITDYRLSIGRRNF